MTVSKDAQLVARINALMVRTEDAFSVPTYGPSEWRRAIRLLINKGHDDRAIEAILKSKWMRWAADNRPAGTDPRGEDIIVYMRKIKPEQIEALIGDSLPLKGDELAGACEGEDISELIGLAQMVANGVTGPRVQQIASSLLARILARAR